MRLESNSVWIFEEMYIVIKVKLIIMTSEYGGSCNHGTYLEIGWKTEMNQ